MENNNHQITCEMGGDMVGCFEVVDLVEWGVLWSSTRVSVAIKRS